MGADERRPQALLLVGPTGSGKSALAMRLAEELPVEIVSVDSAQVYRGMDIGTAKPDAAERARVPHHLLDIREPEESYSAGEFRDDAARLIPEIQARGRVPLLVGGTLLYVRALLHGIAAMPRADEALRRELDGRAAAKGWPALHAELAARDPDSAARIHPHDAQRIQRALEVLALTGRPRGELWEEKASPAAARPRIAAFSLEPADREVLHRRIATRFQAMLDAGLVEEVRRLHARPGLTAEHASMRAVGYRQLWAFCDGRSTLPEAVAASVAATRQLAKRQLTWLRGPLLRPAEHASTLDPQNGQCYELFRDGVLQWLHRTV